MAILLLRRRALPNTTPVRHDAIADPLRRRRRRGGSQGSADPLAAALLPPLCCRRFAAWLYIRIIV